MKTKQCEVFILGAGAGGIGAAYRLAKHGVHTIIADRNKDYGGTMIFAGVHTWEPGVSMPGLHNRLAEEIMNIPGGGGTALTVPRHLLYSIDENTWRRAEEAEHVSFEELPIGLSVIHPKLRYEQTLKRCLKLLKKNEHIKRFQFEPSAMQKAIHHILSETCYMPETLFQTEFVNCETERGRITAVRLKGKEEEYRIEAKIYIDASGNIILARSAGCKAEIQAKPNGVSYLFRVGKGEKREWEKMEKGGEGEGEWSKDYLRKHLPAACYNVYPNLDINVNILPVMTGEEYFKLDKRADQIGWTRVKSYWKYMQEVKGLNNYVIKEVFAMPGIRESWRLKGENVLTDKDIKRGYRQQDHKDEIIAYADHAMDTHGAEGGCKEIEKPYGIPFSCLLPKEIENLVVACRGASFDSNAASSCRLSRTMLSLGEAAGEGVTIWLEKGKVDRKYLRERLGCLDDELMKVYI